MIDDLLTEKIEANSPGTDSLEAVNGLRVMDNHDHLRSVVFEELLGGIDLHSFLVEGPPQIGSDNDGRSLETTAVLVRNCD